MHFASTRHEENNRVEQWHQLFIKTDFVEVLKEHGRLPIASASEQFQLLRDLKQYKKELVQMKE